MAFARIYLAMAAASGRVTFRYPAYLQVVSLYERIAPVILSENAEHHPSRSILIAGPPGGWDQADLVQDVPVDSCRQPHAMLP